MTPLEELFAEEDAQKRAMLIELSTHALRCEKELQLYQDALPASMSDDPVAWWWYQRQTFPVLSEFAYSYLCAQASSTPSERVFSTEGDTVSAERAAIQPEKADMVVFLNKNGVFPEKFSAVCVLRQLCE